MKPREFEQIVDSLYADLYRFAYSLARNEADACDLTQQTFAILAQKGNSVRELGKCKSWLFTALYREFIKQGKRSSRVVSMPETDLELSLSEARPADPHLGEHTELLEALAGLEESHRAILTLFYLDDYSYKTISESLDIPIGTVMSRLSRAKDALRAKMKGPPDEGINRDGKPSRF